MKNPRTVLWPLVALALAVGLWSLLREDRQDVQTPPAPVPPSSEQAADSPGEADPKIPRPAPSPEREPDAKALQPPEPPRQTSEGAMSLLERVKQMSDAGGGTDAAKAWLTSASPAEQAAGLAMLAGRGRLDEVADLASFSPSSVLAALDASHAAFGAEAHQSLLTRWIEAVGGIETAGVTAHTLLLEGDLELGGGLTALDLMEQVNEPAAIFVGLRGFVVDPYLDSTTRLEALLRLRQHMAFEEYQAFVEHARERAAGETGLWPLRLARFREHIEGPPTVQDGPVRFDDEFLRLAVTRPYPTLLQDLEMFLRHAAAAGRLQVGSLPSWNPAEQLSAAASSAAEELAAQRLAELLTAHAQPDTAP